MKYDVIIIGSGIGGLVCGCYLAKSRLKVLIIERNNKTGGYCSSFEKEGYQFDVGVHYLSGIKKGILGNVLEGLELRDQIIFNRLDPTDKIIMPDNMVFVRANSSDTIEGFKKSFPKEKNNITKFFKFIMQDDYLRIYIKLKNLTFKELMDGFFRDYKLKAMLGALLSNIGTSPDYSPAFTAVSFFRQYILDPGYYPCGGIQVFPDTLVRYLKRKGGDLLLEKEVKEISVLNNEVQGVVLDDGKIIYSKVIVSNVDATQTFTKLMNVKTREAKVVKKLLTSPSLFLVYLVLKNTVKKFLKEQCNIMYFNTYNINKLYSNPKKTILEKKLSYLSCSFPSLHNPCNISKKITAILSLLAPFENAKFWEGQKNNLTNKMLVGMNELIPNFMDFVELKISASPHTLYKYTLNKNGAFVGWLPSVYQAKSLHLPQTSSVKGLYLVGTWYSSGSPGQGGIPNVAFSGKKGADLVLGYLNKN